MSETKGHDPQCPMPNYCRDNAADLRAKWNDEGHAVMFNHAKDDLTPAERVGKWLEEATR